MDKEQLQKEWKHFLIDVGMSETQLAKALEMHAPNLNRKIKEGTIKYLELASILERYGYNINIRKND